MGMYAVLCTLSDKRLAQLEEEPGLLGELLLACHDTEIPGLLYLDKAWDALDLLISDRGKDPVLKDAVLARTGRHLRASTAFGPAQVLGPERVREIAAALAKLPADLVRQRYSRILGAELHGGYGSAIAAPDDVKYVRDKIRETQEREIAELERKLAMLVALYARAAAAGHAMMGAIA
ncbi:MAG TPA: DUF1877 family protein [Kofleriaceae bacterium]|nr:DUF1877 family protein [Kofleriaceae bacterium]